MWQVKQMVRSLTAVRGRLRTRANNSYRNAQKHYFYIFLQKNLHILKISSTFAENS